jgi:hypothetical protein
MGWKRDGADEARLIQLFKEQGRPEELPPVQVWKNAASGLYALLAREYCGGRRTDPLRWHISVSSQIRVPNWEEMAEAAHAIRPGVHFVIMVPPKSWWMSVHPNVLHLWQTDDQPLIEEARVNAQAMGVSG